MHCALCFPPDFAAMGDGFSMRLCQKNFPSLLFRQRPFRLAAPPPPPAGLAAIAPANHAIRPAARGRCFAGAATAPRHRAGLAPGPARALKSGAVNLPGTQPRFPGPPVPVGPGAPQPPPVL